MSRVALVALLLIAGCLGPPAPADEGPGSTDDVGVDPGADGGASGGPGAGDGAEDSEAERQDLMDRIEAAIEQALRDG